jgi:hypothetical protein
MSYCVYHLLQSSYSFILRFFFVCGLNCEKLPMYIIHRQILCGVVKCGMDILEAFRNPFDLPQPVNLYVCMFLYCQLDFYYFLCSAEQGNL